MIEHIQAWSSKEKRMGPWGGFDHVQIWNHTRRCQPLKVEFEMA